MEHTVLFSAYSSGSLELKNRIVMAPMTRCRAINNIPNSLIAEYYAQRASAGLIITEGTSPSPNGLGYARIPGIYSREQIEGWKLVTSAVHANGGKIFIQLMHTGRVSHIANMPAGSVVLAPSEIQVSGQMYTDAEGMKDHTMPKAMTAEDIQTAIKEYITAAKNAIEAGFDGIELHGANGYLIEQFISPVSNERTDEYGGSIENRARFVIEIAKGAVEAIGKDKVGIRFSPYGPAGDMKPYPELEDTYVYLSEHLSALRLSYIHIVDHSAMGAPEVPETMKEKMRNAFKGTIILSGGYDADRAEKDLVASKGDLIAFGRPFISNPDLVHRLKNSIPYNADVKSELFYTPGKEGYTDYPIV
ncbi:MAG: alkene reductase [Cytophagales bacterium]|nr:alkene reductase [Cytophaga sp.]